MKKTLLTLSVILLTAMSAIAGGDRSSDRPLYAKWYQNWFIDASGSLNAWQQSVNRAAFVDFNQSPATLNYKNAAGDFGRYGGSVKIGKLLNPCVAIRLGLDMNQATYQPSKTAAKQDFVLETAHFDLMLSLMDLFGGYRNDRIYRLFLFGGFGIAAHTNDFFVFNPKQMNKEFCAVAGLTNNFRLGKHFDFHIDLQAIAPKYTIENQFGAPDPKLVNLNLSALAGLTWYMGGRHFDFCEACPEVECPEADCSAKDKEIKNLQNKINELQANANNTNTGAVVNQPCDTVVKFINGETAPMSIFFNKDSYQIRDNRDLINLQEMAKVAKDNGYKINLRGTCDSATATSEYNKKLAENRCRKIKDELVKLGVAESKIIMDVVGGVNELKPAEYNRRVLVTFSK